MDKINTYLFNPFAFASIAVKGDWKRGTEILSEKRRERKRQKERAGESERHRETGEREGERERERARERAREREREGKVDLAGVYARELITVLSWTPWFVKSFLSHLSLSKAAIVSIPNTQKQDHSVIQSKLE